MIRRPVTCGTESRFGHKAVSEQRSVVPPPAIGLGDVGSRLLRPAIGQLIGPSPTHAVNWGKALYCDFYVKPALS